MSRVEWQQARELCYEAGLKSARRGVQELPLDRAVGAVLAEDVRSPLSLPHYDSSAMDGFAVAGSSPWQLVFPPEATDSRQNIHRRAQPLHTGQATPILTGGLIPAGASAVIRSEHTRAEGGLLYSLAEDPAEGADIRRAGEELAAGDLLVAAGTVLSARHIALVAVSGIDELTVVRRPALACAFTGNEVIESGIPGAGEVRDAYAPAFPPLLEQMGAQLLALDRLHDDMGEVSAFFDRAAADFILATGGSANSEVDILRRYLQDVGARFIFESVRMRPGHPTLLAELADGRLVLGLPGNPLAAYTALYSFLPPLVAGWLGNQLPGLTRAKVLNSVPAFTKESTRCLPCLVSADGVTIFTRATRSHMLSALAQANGLAAVAPRGVAEGEDIEVIGF